MKAFTLKTIVLIISLFFSSLIYADPYGTFQITGLALKYSGKYVIVYGRYVDSANQLEPCAPVGSYWFAPPMDHMFWMPNDNPQMYSLLLTLVQTKANAFIGAVEEHLQYNSIVRCKITDITTK